MLKSYKYRIYPNKEQEILLSKHFGCVRFIYNKALEYKIEYYKNNGKNISSYDLMKLVTIWKKEEDKIWLNEVLAQSLQQSIIDLGSSYNRFFKKNCNFPNFKSKKTNRHTYRIPQKISIVNKKIILPKFQDGISIRVDKFFNGKIKSGTVEKTPSGKYFISILVDDMLCKPRKKEVDKNTTIGIDLGIKDFATLSDGTKILNPKVLKSNLIKLKVLQQRLSKKTIGSSNRNKARTKVARQHEKIANIRKDFLQKLTTSIINDSQINTICLETLDIKEMLKNKKLSREISDVSWAEFIRMLEYKAMWSGKNILRIGQFEPSSKMCSCGIINNELKLSDRVWTCTNCNTTHDRDILAANNIKNIALKNSGLGKSVELVELSA